ncbi:hypothetical protein N798_00300 [Knoellia flava TL1]|uniref:Uncharacterized protein n=2 Tax=Knoellia flava TaxID=913969 RepID=A0A8H9FUV4_9MICO|nr:hypothetical protein [Knoellia flava]KGN35731.1 hypothetical protein N798_00300 [Knoellia flava TL1]GGB81292.1 hypothetical protein GCM10011314_21120 [Knoellia flava]
MRARPAAALLRVAVAVGLLGVVLVDVARTATSSIAVIAGIGCAAVVLAVVGLVRGGGFEARLVAAVVSAVSLVLAVVGMVFGAPGSGAGGVTVRELLVVVLSVATLVLLRLAAPTRSVRDASSGTYAR